MTTAATKTLIIDGDGHVMEDVMAVTNRIPEELRQGALVKASGAYPQLDNLHTGSFTSPPGSFQNPGVKGWSEFLDSTGFSASVLYPTAGLGFCRLVDPDLAAGLARAHNDWLYETYLQADSRLKGVALLPMQDPAAAVDELRHSIEDLGMPVAMLPPNGLRSPLGSKEYWPIYEEANRLGCALGIHGGAHQDLGLNYLEVFAGTHALGHPFGLAVQFVDLLVNRIFDRFPNVRFGFMEGGLAWFMLVAERLPGSYGAFRPVNRDRFLDVEGHDLHQYIADLIDSGRLYVGVEGDEPALGYAVKTFGRSPFVFSSDFPHEVNVDTIGEELEELTENEDLSSEDRHAILYSNAERFYKLQT